MGIHLQQLKGSSANFGFTFDDKICHREVIVPRVASRIEQIHLLACVGINRGKIWSLVQVTTRARPGEIARIVIRLMDRRHNVLDMERQLVGAVWSVTVFATLASPDANLPTSFSRDAHDCDAKNWRARDLSTVTSSSSSM